MPICLNLSDTVSSKEPYGQNILLNKSCFSIVVDFSLKRNLMINIIWNWGSNKLFINSTVMQHHGLYSRWMHTDSQVCLLWHKGNSWEISLSPRQGTDGKGQQNQSDLPWGLKCNVCHDVPKLVRIRPTASSDFIYHFRQFRELVLPLLHNIFIWGPACADKEHCNYRNNIPNKMWYLCVNFRNFCVWSVKRCTPVWLAHFSPEKIVNL